MRRADQAWVVDVILSVGLRVVVVSGELKSSLCNLGKGDCVPY